MRQRRIYRRRRWWEKNFFWLLLLLLEMFSLSFRMCVSFRVATTQNKKSKGMWPLTLLWSLILILIFVLLLLFFALYKISLFFQYIYTPLSPFSSYSFLSIHSRNGRHCAKNNKWLSDSVQSFTQKTLYIPLLLLLVLFFLFLQEKWRMKR